MPATDAFTEALARGPVYAALAALAGGFVVSLTPCVYPMVAVTVSVFGAREAKSRWEGALLSAAFVLGIVAMNDIKKTGQQGRGMALAAVIVGGVSLALTVLFWLTGVITDTSTYR